MNQRQKTAGFESLDHELWFARRIGTLIDAAFSGATDRPIRMQRCRLAIIAAGLEKVILGKRPDGKTETCAEGFERLYGEPLQPKPRKEGK